VLYVRRNLQQYLIKNYFALNHAEKNIFIKLNKTKKKDLGNMIQKKPFRSYSLEEQQDKPISVKLNTEERTLLDECKVIIEQTKDSTALKTLAWIGAKVIREEKQVYILATIFKNKRKNERLGIVDFE
jgi:hypothetical protein